MIMAIDVSNTNITLGTFNGAKLLKIYRVTTKVPRTSDEYGVLLRDLVRLSNASHHDIEGIIIASVVPNVMYSLHQIFPCSSDHCRSRCENRCQSRCGESEGSRF